MRLEMDDFTQIEEVEAYLDDKLTSEQKALIEEKILLDPEYHDVVELVKASREAVVLAGYKEVIASVHKDFQLRGIRNSAGPSIYKGKQNLTTTVLRGIAASIIFVLLATSVLVWDTKSNYLNRKYLDYKVPVERSTGNSQDDLIKWYAEENWNEILDFVPADDTDPQYLFFAGMANFKLGNFDQAKVQFDKIRETGISGQSNVFMDEAEFYSAFTYLKMNQYAEALQIIEKINTVPDHNYYGYFSAWDQFKLGLVNIF
jgi:tetratricopeptide (TPR) repeat protein